MIFKKFKDFEQDFTLVREYGISRGHDTGFSCLDEIYSIKQGAYTIILAEPHSGKSEFGFELCMNQAAKFGKKIMVYSPETGSVADIFAELVHKHARRPVYKSKAGHLNDKELYQAAMWVDDRFNIVNSDDHSYTFEELMKACTDEDILFIDPANEVRQDFAANYGTRQDLYIEDISADIRRWNKNHGKHTILTMHPASQQPIYDKESGSTYFPMPKARQAAGGQAWYRKAMGWINLWRPPSWMINPRTGAPYDKFSLQINVQKAKPKGIGWVGDAELFWNPESNRYSERISGMDFYAFDHEANKSYMQPSMNFYEKDNENEEEPF